MTDRLLLDKDVDRALERARKELRLTRDGAIRAILRDWLEGHAYLPVRDLDEDSPTKGEA
ncbi:hypothetical protein IB238_09215 [Rhizobium sp. ARZ01]|uniref:hypothetical protein n=1 Tax=Rhizobium sp. ARZ01 TaxID=2769313 RepID=UPI00177FF867|nr:hypothetical protein [Rhizobium sp. ARZ01]MBD9372797.1 hypothetical protein [Rhizobium sp. ARZ01]